MTFLSVVSFLVPVFSLAAKGGIAHQVTENYRRKSVDGVSVPFYAIGILSYATFTLYGILVRALPVVVAQLPGVALSLVVLGQWMHYRKRVTVISPPGGERRGAHEK